MAEGDVGVEKSVEELEREITCAVCHDHYNEPKVLPCLHYYCKQCVYSLALRTGLDKPFFCPECRTDATLPQGSVDNLKTAFFINRMKVVHTKLERVHGKVEAKCEMCSGSKAEAFCRQCVQFICEKCVDSHKRMKVFAGHKVSRLDELKEGGAKVMAVQESLLQTCEVHEEQMKIYCFDCNRLICRDCTVKDHLGHNYEFIKKAAPEMKKKLIRQLEPLKKAQVNFSRTMDTVQTTRSKLAAQGNTVSAKIKDSFKKLRHILDNREEELLKDVEVKVTTKLDALTHREKSVSTASTAVQSVMDYTQQCVEHSADDEIMCMHADIQNRIDADIEQHCKAGNGVESVEETLLDLDVEVSLADDLKQLCQEKAKLTNILMEKYLIISGRGLKTARLNEVSQFFVSMKPSNVQALKQTLEIDAHLQPSPSRGKKIALKTITCEVNRIKPGLYRIQYTPAVAGEHQLTVTVNREEVTGSPFSVNVLGPSGAYKEEEIKVLILGAMKSGKSTFCKQMRHIYYGAGYSKQDRLSFAPIIYRNILCGLQTLLKQRSQFGISFENPKNAEYGELVSSCMCETGMGAGDFQQYAVALKSLRDDGGIQATMRRSSEFQLGDCMPYFMIRLEAVSAKGYVPSFKDVLCSSVTTTGIIEYAITINKTGFRFVDVGGARTERRKWIHTFDDVAAIFFLTASSGFDQTLWESDTTNRLQESVDLFEAIVNKKFFKSTPIILLFNKTDILAEKIAVKNIREYFSDFMGDPHRLEDVQHFLVNTFQSKVQQNERQDFYKHFITATDTDSVRDVFTTVKDTVLTYYQPDMLL